MISKESSILEYLTGVLGGQLHQLWKLSPALAAAAIPSWSPFLRNLHLFCYADAAIVLKIRRNTRTVNLLREFGASTSFMYWALI
nr:hypothetical protein CFP56_56210 [Quercus suber]